MSDAGTTPVIELQGITKRYPVGDGWFTALHDVSLRIDANEYVAIVGPSGSGKSTLMNVLGCLDVPTSGRYLLQGRDVAGLDEEQLAVARNQAVGFIFQSFNLLPRADALHNVMQPLVYRRLPVAERKGRAREALEKVGLGARLDHKPNQLSGGQCQRVAVARALVGQPAILLADEPTGNLDEETADRVFDALLATVRDSGVAVLVATHNLELASRADAVLRLHNGRIETVPSRRQASLDGSSSSPSAGSS